jgi:hypothetical protein
MRSILIGAALLALAVPANAKTAPAKSMPRAAQPKAQASAKKMPDLDIGRMMEVFDKIFPPQPDPPATRLALSRTAVMGLFPEGTYARMMGGMMNGVVDRVMGLSAADFGKKESKAGDTLTLRQQMTKNDPHFDERMAIIQRIVTEEFAKLAAIIEPRMRDGLARSMARRFDEKQLADLNAFLATDSGRAYGSQSMAMYIDPDVMRAMMGSFPEMMKEMPAAMQRIEAETAGLPKPAKPKEARK